MELDSGADSVTSTPRSTHFKPSDDKSMVRLMCSFGGKILPRPHDNQLRYVGGDTRIVAVHRSTSFPSLLSKLSKLLPPNSGDFTVKYQLPHEDLDALITVSTDEDVDNMMDEFDRLLLQNTNAKTPRLRLFLFPNNPSLQPDSRTSSIASLLDGSRKRESWFLDALNGENGSGLERGRSEASSIVSEVPDYLFGLDNSDESQVQPPAKFKNRVGLGDVTVAGSDPGSPAVQVSVSSPFGSTSSAPPMMPNLPPVKTKPDTPVEEVVNEPPVQAPVGYAGGPVWSHHNPNPTPTSPYPGHPTAPMQAIPVYYVAPGPNPVSRGHAAHLQPVPVTVPGPYVPQYGPSPVQVPVGYPGSGGPMYAGGGVVRPMGGPMDPYEMQMQGNMVPGPPGAAGQPVYYGVKNPGQQQHGMIAPPYPGMVQPMGPEDGSGLGQDPNKGRAHQG